MKDTATQQNQIHSAFDDEVQSYFQDQDENTLKDDAGIIVIKSIGDPKSNDGRKLNNQYRGVLGRKLPFRKVERELEQLHTELCNKFPWSENCIDVLIGQLCMQAYFSSNYFKLPPILLAGPQGTGKTTLLKELCAACDVPFQLVSGAIPDSGGLFGVSRGWATSKPSALFNFMVDNNTVNPVVFIDELDKALAITENKNGNLQSCLLTMMGAKDWYDPCLLSALDLSQVSFLASANDVDVIYGPLRDRFMILEMSEPGIEHIDICLENIRREFQDMLGCQKLPYFPELASRLVKRYRATVSGSISLRSLKKEYADELRHFAMQARGFEVKPAECKTTENLPKVGFALH